MVTWSEEMNDKYVRAIEIHNKLSIGLTFVQDRCPSSKMGAPRRPSPYWNRQ